MQADRGTESANYALGNSKAILEVALKAFSNSRRIVLEQEAYKQ